MTYNDLTEIDADAKLDPLTDGHIVRMEVPRAGLVAFGLEPRDLPTERSTVLADVLVGEDGLARAVRFVRAVNR